MKFNYLGSMSRLRDSAAAGSDAAGGVDMYGSTVAATPPAVVPASTSTPTVATVTPAVTSSPSVAPSAPAAPVAPAVPATVKLDAATIAELKAATGGEISTKKEAEQLTAEQIRDILNPVVVTNDTLKGMGFENASPEQVVAFQNLMNAAVKNAVSVSRLMLEQEAHKFQQQLTSFNPVISHFQQQQAKAQADAFYGQYPALTKYPQLVKMAATELLGDSNVTKLDAAGQMKAVGERVMATLQSLNITISEPASPSAPVVNEVPKPNALATGGRSGAPGTTGQSNKPTSIYD